MNHVAVILISPDQQAGHRAEHGDELHQRIEVEGIVRHVQGRGGQQQERRHPYVPALDLQVRAAPAVQADGEHQRGRDDGAAAHVDQRHFQAAEEDGTHPQLVAQHQVEDVLQDGESATHGRAADDAVDEKGNLLPTGQDQQRDGLHRLFHHRIDEVGHRLRKNHPRELEQPEADQRGGHAAEHQQEQAFHADERETVQHVHHDDVDDDGKEGGDEGHYRSLRDIMNSLPWRPPGKSAGANRWP